MIEVDSRRFVQSLSGKPSVNAGAEADLLRHERRKTGQRSIDGFCCRSRFFQDFFVKFRFRDGKGVCFLLSMGNKVRPSREYLPDRTHVLGYMLDAVQDGPLVVAENQVAVFSHKLRDEFLDAEIPQFVPVLHRKNQDSFQARLSN